jgi:putative transposase
MPDPKPPVVELSPAQRLALQTLVNRHSTPQQLALRARLILEAEAGLNNSEIGRKHGFSTNSVRLWRDRWLSFAAIPLEELSVEERLADIPRAGKPSAITPEQVCRIVALACELPEESGRPITQWSASEIAAEIIKRGILPTISPRHAARILKRGISSPTRFARG